MNATTHTLGVELGDVEAAARRIDGNVRRTPVMHASPAKRPITQAELWLKLDQLQISGSFKARGAMNKALLMSDAERARGLVTASGGNHGLAVAHAAWRLGVAATVYLPSNAPMSKETGLQAWGATVVRHGSVWDEANVAALEFAARTGASYIHAFEDPAVIAGQGTLALEILADLPQVDVIVAAIGGGGLMSGVSLAAKALKPEVKLIAVEPTGAPTLFQSVRAGHLVTLEAIHTAANTLAPRRSSQINLDLIRAHVDEIVLVSDDDMREAARWLWREYAIAAELSGAAAVAAIMSGQIALEPAQTVCAIVCGAGTDGVG